MSHEPRIEQRAEESYAGIAGEASDEGEFRSFVDRSFPELFGWLGSRGIAPAGAPFIRYLELSSDGQPLRFELGVPTGAPPDADGPVRAGTLPAGRYAIFLHVGPYSHAEVDDLSDARSRLAAWAEREGITLESSATARGTAFHASLERYLTDASREPDWSEWETELSHLIDSH
jgi:effector-binding domain-containing protein